MVSLLLALAATALIGGAIRRARARGTMIAALQERLRDLASRVDAAEVSAAEASARAGVAESLLLEKGIADEEDLEAARRRSGADVGSRYVPGRDGELH